MLFDLIPCILSFWVLQNLYEGFIITLTIERVPRPCDQSRESKTASFPFLPPLCSPSRGRAFPSIHFAPEH